MTIIREKVLVLFSGGKDSFITACREVIAGNEANLISFNNSAVLGETNLLHGVRRLQRKYSEYAVKYIGCYNTGAIIQKLETYYANASQKELGEKYPNLINAQLRCLHCQTAMWIAAIAYATSHGCMTIVSGYRKSDPFCTGHIDYVEFIRTIAKKFQCDVRLPVWNDDAWTESAGGSERDNEMADYGFEPAVYEPKCMLGRPVSHMTSTEYNDMRAYVRDVLEPQMYDEIQHMSGIMRTINLGPVSMEIIDFPLPDE